VETAIRERPPAPAPVVTASGLTKIYAGRAVLDIDRLDVGAGEILAIMGPSGSGKTTLLRLLSTLEEPTAGEVRFEDRVWGPGGLANGNGRELLAWRRSIAFVPHNPALFTGTVRENVRLALELRNGRSRQGRRGWTEGETDAVLETVGLTQLAGALSSSLSSGEVQRVALARALVTRPRVLFLDEPTANLDPANVAIIERSLADAVRSWGPAVVLVTHNLFQARRLAHRAGLMVGGELVELGETGQVFERPGDPRTAAFVRGEMVC